MSAFMVNDKTINEILAWLRHLARSSDGRWTVSALEENGFGYDLKSDEGLSALGEAMFDLNARGVNSRYGDNQAQEFRPLDYQYMGMMPTNEFQAYKSLGCLLYQCMEGDIPEASNLYKALREIENRIAHDIVRKNPKYDAARWG
jgi:hypothetical protein